MTQEKEKQINDFSYLIEDMRDLFETVNGIKIILEKLQTTCFTKEEKDDFIIMKSKYLEKYENNETIYDKVSKVITVLDGNGAPENGLINRLIKLEDNYYDKVVEIDKRITALESIEVFKTNTQKQNKETKSEWNTIISIILGIITLLTFVHNLLK